jgi:NitT/TauT family transport system substrate-binding protein
MKKLLIFILAALSLSGLMTACSTTNSSQETPIQSTSPVATSSEASTLATTTNPITLRVGAKCGPSPHAMPLFLMLAQTQGQLSDNVTVEYVPVTEPSQMVALLKTGEVDAMVGFVVQTANIFQKGGVSNLRLLNVPLWKGFYVVASPDITSWEHLKGQVVAMPNPQGGPSQIAEASMRHAGFDLEKDFQVQHMPAAQIIQMLVTGKVQAGVVSEPFATIAMMKAKKNGVSLQVAPIDLYNIFAAEKWPSDQLPIGGALTLQSVLDDSDKAAALALWEEAYYAAIDEMLENPQKASQLIATQLGKYCDSKMKAEPLAKALGSGLLFYEPRPAANLLPDLDAYLEQMTGREIDDAFYAPKP